FPENGMLMSSYFPEEENLSAIKEKVEDKLRELAEIGFQTQPHYFESKDLKEEEWANAWKQHYHSVRVTRFLTIVPKWESYTPVQEGEHCIYLDPGLAFGTGTHPTTVLSLQGLETVIRGGESILDVGTGSGVLTIASSLLGAKEIQAFDLDDI